MKKLTIYFLGLFLIFGAVGGVNAVPIDFKVDTFNSGVDLDNLSTFGWTSLEAKLVDVFSDFSLGTGSSHSFDFIKFTTTGTGVGSFDINATLAFERPENFQGDYEGGGGWGTIITPWWGSVSGGFLTWTEASKTSILSDGNKILMELEQGITILSGSSTILKATVTNLGGAEAVPEPATLIFMGIGILGLLAGRKKFQQNLNP